MTNYFIVKVKFHKNNEEGVIKKVKQTILVDSMSFTECEKRALEELTPYMEYKDSLEIVSIKKAPYTEVITDVDGEYFFEAVVNFAHPQDNGTIKNEKQKILLQGNDITSVYENITESMKGSTLEYNIDCVKITNITEFYLYIGCGDIKTDTHSFNHGNQDFHNLTV